MGNNGSNVAATFQPQRRLSDGSGCNSLPGSPVQKASSLPLPPLTGSRDNSRPGTPKEDAAGKRRPAGTTTTSLVTTSAGSSPRIRAREPPPPLQPLNITPNGHHCESANSPSSFAELSTMCHPSFPLPDTPGPSHHDIFISYRHSDAAVMTKLKGVLRNNGFSVWVDESSINVGANFISKIGEGICGSKIFMSVVTEGTYQSRYCVDELCLAYIKEKPIYAVSLCTQEDMFARFPTSIKLIVSRFDWTTVSDENFQNDIETVLVSKLKAELKGESADDLSPSPFSPKVGRFTRKQAVKKPHTRSRVYSRVFNRSISRGNSMIESADDLDSEQEFWERNFHDQDCVTWQRFEEAFLCDYNEQLKRTYESSDKEWFTVILKRELGVEKEIVHIDKYKEFILDNDGIEQSILICVNDLCRENLAMREVFSLDSTVRISAINNLALCHSPAVVEALLDLLNEQEHDVRASACLSLAKVKGGFETVRIDRLQRCLRDSDRFVRQASCAALGYLKAHAAVDELLRVWRNDHVTDVRQEAESALRYIGGEKVDNKFRTTNVLKNEISEFTKMLESPKNGPNLHHKNHPGKAVNNHLKAAKVDHADKYQTFPRIMKKVNGSEV